MKQEQAREQAFKKFVELEDEGKEDTSLENLGLCYRVQFEEYNSGLQTGTGTFAFFDYEYEDEDKLDVKYIKEA